MNDGGAINFIWIAVAFVLVTASLIARRISLSMVARAALGWAAIGLVAFYLIAHRHEIGGAFARVSEGLGLDDQLIQGQTVRIRMDTDGHFWARASLNGVERRMLIDSGATTTAISEATARAAGIDARGDGLPILIETANGTVAATRGRIGRLDIGPLSTTDLGAVISPSFGEMDVLGMNFLSRLKSWRVEGNVLVLEPGGAQPSAEDGANGGDS